MVAKGGEGRGIFLIIIKLTSGQFPKHELNSQSIKQAGRKWPIYQRQLPPLSNTSVEISGGLTNPHTLQQQHPLWCVCGGGGS